jgi:hypothetical protein
MTKTLSSSGKMDKVALLMYVSPINFRLPAHLLNDFDR